MAESRSEYTRYLQLISKSQRFAVGEGPPLTLDEVHEFWKLHTKFGGASPFSNQLEITLEKVMNHNESLIEAEIIKRRVFEDAEDKRNLKAIAEALSVEEEKISRERARQAQRHSSKDDDRGR